MDGIYVGLTFIVIQPIHMQVNVVLLQQEALPSSTYCFSAFVTPIGRLSLNQHKYPSPVQADNCVLQFCSK